MVKRVTTNGMMMSYRSNLMRSYQKLGHVSEQVTTQRRFNSYAESPAKASQAFQLRRNRWNTESQISNSKYVVHKFQQAWNSLESVYQDLGNSMVKYSDLRAKNDTLGSGRAALGETIKGAAESMVQTMNAKFGENFIFSGSDGKRVPFEIENGKVYYRGIDVDGPTQADMDKLQETLDEHTYVDLGMGMKENPNDGTLIGSSAFDTALNGLQFLGHGTGSYTFTNADGTPGKTVTGLPNNLISICNELGRVWSGCDPDSGAFAADAVPAGSNAADADEYVTALENKLQDALNGLHENWISDDTKSTFLKNNQSRLESLDDALNEQITTLEDIDPAEAITSLMWAQYSYNAALRIGTNLLSQSLIDYMN